MGFDYPNLPYLIDGNVKLTETIAIEEYIIKSSKNKDLIFQSKDFKIAAKVNMFVSVIKEF